MKRIDSNTNGWSDYELLDSGEFRKLERFGSIIIDRPDPQALWKKRTELWDTAVAQFAWKQKGERWSIEKGTLESWNIRVDDVSIAVSFGQFKHIGIFPEHYTQWQELKELAYKKPKMTMLNLFGYTGVASLIAAQAGALVTHVDASKQTIGMLKANMELSNVNKNQVKIIVEDALKYTKRLISRGETFDCIVLDPPAFGRGPKGEVWKIEEKLPELLSYIPKLLSPNASLVLLNGYAAGFHARSFGEALSETCSDRGGEISYGDVFIQESSSDRQLPTGIYAVWRA